jgi:hypothetical protein
MFGSNWDLVNHQAPFACPQKDLHCGTIRLHFGFGSNWGLVKYQVPFAFYCVFYPQVDSKQILQVGDCVTSLPCWGRVVIGSNRVYQTRSTGSNPVASTTVLTVSARSIGNGQKRWISFAWEGPERSGPFLIPKNYTRQRFPHPFFHQFR